MNMTVTNNDPGKVLIEAGVYVDELLTLAGADTIAAGTLLARDSVSLKLVLFVKGGVANENGIPKAVLTYPVTVTGAGDVTIRALASGKLRRDKLIIDADGDATNVDGAVTDQLRDYGLEVVSVSELNIQDNQ